MESRTCTSSPRPRSVPRRLGEKRVAVSDLEVTDDWARDRTDPGYVLYGRGDEGRLVRFGSHADTPRGSARSRTAATASTTKHGCPTRPRASNRAINP